MTEPVNQGPDVTSGPNFHLSPPIEDRYAPSLSGKEPIERESLRSTVAKYLVYSFIAQMILPFAVVLKWPEYTENVLKILTITVSPTVALLGAVMGFYFGSNPNSK